MALEPGDMGGNKYLDKPATSVESSNCALRNLPKKIVQRLLKNKSHILRIRVGGNLSIVE